MGQFPAKVILRSVDAGIARNTRLQISDALIAKRRKTADLMATHVLTHVSGP